MISISVCMIVKDEANILARCLDSLSGLYEELIIVDTGSQDATKEIAAKYTDKIYDYEWIEDFADARNFAFSKATKEYIYSVDADEVLDETNRKRLMRLKETILPEIEIVQMWYVNTKEFGTTENYAKEYRPKLYKRLREFHWIDPIHETINLTPVVYDSDIEILHMPEDKHSKRDFRVFLNSIQRGYRLSPKLHKMYARELCIAGEMIDFENAFPYFLQAVYDREKSEEEQTMCYVILSHYYRCTGDIKEFFKWSLKNICTVPCSEICNELGIYYYDERDYHEALVWFQNALTETEALLDIRANEAIPHEMMIKCYEGLAEEDELMRDIYIAEAEEIRSIYQS